jgi:hypothetical protein
MEDGSSCAFKKPRDEKEAEAYRGSFAVGRVGGGAFVCGICGFDGDKIGRHILGHYNRAIIVRDASGRHVRTLFPFPGVEVKAGHVAHVWFCSEPSCLAHTRASDPALMINHLLQHNLMGEWWEKDVTEVPLFGSTVHTDGADESHSFPDDSEMCSGGGIDNGAISEEGEDSDSSGEDLGSDDSELGCDELGGVGKLSCAQCGRSFLCRNLGRHMQTCGLGVKPISTQRHLRYVVVGNAACSSKFVYYNLLITFVICK